MVRLLISLIIIVCCTLIGEMYASSFRRRTFLLRSLLQVLQTLETEIVYGGTPLPLIALKISKNSAYEISNIFSSTAKILFKKDGRTFSQAWSYSLKICAKNSDFRDKDIRLLAKLGEILGATDIDNQVKHIRLTMVEIKKNYEEAAQMQMKNVKLFKQIGLLSGIAIVIILY
ncbi:MAG: stage III sporulation protein SpoIIIAB [Alkaliphilus sp.]